MSTHDGKISVVTGGGGGIGRGVCIEAAQRGFTVAVVDIRKESAEKVANEIIAMGGKAYAYACDISEIQSVQDTHKKILSELGPITQLWANAGVGIVGGLLEADPQKLDWLLSVNLFGTLNTIKTFIPPMLEENKPGNIVVTASATALYQFEKPMAAYGSTKHMTMGIAEALRAELADTKLSVTAICPGRVRTEIWNSAKARPERFGGEALLPEEKEIEWSDGVEPSDLAKMTFEAIEKDQFFVITTHGHNDSLGLMRDRLDKIEKAFP